MNTSQTKSLIVALPRALGVVAKKQKPKKAKVMAQKPVSTKLVPVAIGRTINTGQPKITPKATGMIAKNREYCFTVNGGTDTLVYSHFINAQNASLFPWLSRLAGNYEFYKFKKLKFSYESLVATSTPGIVAQAIDYDVTDADPASRQQLMTYEGAKRANVWQSCDLVSTRQSHMLKERYNAPSGGIPTGSDPKLYDVGKIIGFTAGCTGFVGVPVGEVYVDYECELSVPQTQSLSQILGPYSAEVTSATGTPTLPFGDTPTIVGKAIANAFGSQIGPFLRAGQYLLTTFAYGSGAALTGQSLSTSGDGLTIGNGQYTNTGTAATLNYVINVTQAAVVAGRYLNWVLTGTGALTNNYAKIAPFPYS